MSPAGGKGPNLEKVAGLLGLLQEQHEKTGALLTEIAEFLNGGPGIGVQMRAFTDHWQEVWGLRYRGTYQWNRAKTSQDFRNLKRLLQDLGLEALCQRATTYLADEDAYVARARHPFGLFVHGINRYAEAAPAALPLAEAPADCAHIPRCRSEVEHTQQRRAEMRA